MGKVKLEIIMDPEFLNYVKRHYRVVTETYLIPDFSTGILPVERFVKKRLNLFEKILFYISDFVLYLRGLGHGSGKDLFKDLDS